MRFSNGLIFHILMEVPNMLPTCVLVCTIDCAWRVRFCVSRFAFCVLRSANDHGVKIYRLQHERSLALSVCRHHAGEPETKRRRAKRAWTLHTVLHTVFLVGIISIVRAFSLRLCARQADGLHAIVRTHKSVRAHANYTIMCGGGRRFDKRGHQHGRAVPAGDIR